MGINISTRAALAAALSLSTLWTTPLLAKEKKAEPAPVVEATDDPAKFFLFYGPGLTKDQVRGDYVYCVGQSRNIISFRDRYGSGGGLLGAIINARMAEIDRFRMRNAAMRKCMGMMGYERYQVPQEQWKALVKDGDIVLGNDNRVDPEIIENMVNFATGPKPTTEKLPL
jgi:hypothetical protein